MNRLVRVVVVAWATVLFYLPNATTAQIPTYQPAGVGAGETYHLVFVSSQNHVGYIDNIASYNHFVNHLGRESTYKDLNTVPGSWKAIVSTTAGGSGPGEAFTNAPVSGNVYRVDGVQVSDESTANSLYQDPNNFSGILAPISVGEDGGDYAAQTTWTGTQVDGTRRPGDELGAVDSYSNVGQPGQTNEEWLDRTAIGHVTQVYSNKYHLYGLSGPLTGLNSGLADTFLWTEDGVGDWAMASNWTPPLGPPNDPTYTVIFSTGVTGPTTAVTNSDITVNRIEFNNATHSYAVGGLGSVNLATGTDSAGDVPPVVSVLQGSHEFQVRVNLAADTEVNVAAPSALLEFNNRLNLNGNTLNKMGAGTLFINNRLATGTAGAIDCQAGTCSGTGTIGGNLNNSSAIVSPGSSTDSVGTLNVIPEPASLALLVLAVACLAVAQGRSCDR